MLGSAGVVVLSAAGAVGCGSSDHRSTSSAGVVSTPSASASATSTQPGQPAVSRPVRLRSAGTFGRLPAARSGIAAARVGVRIVVSGGLSAAGTSTDTVFRVSARGRSSLAPRLPGPAHDAASAQIGGRLLQFGGGQFEGSDRIIQVLPGRPRQIGTLPQPLSDLVAAAIGGAAYVAGGWNGSDTNPLIYAVDPSGRVRTVGRFPIGVRYPAAAALDGRLILAGGELASGTPTQRSWSFDPVTRRVTRLPDLPAATDHTSGVALAGRVYVLGGLRGGAFTDAILSWAPGERYWQRAGHLPGPLADGGAVAIDGGIAVLGGRDSTGKVATVTLLRPG